MVDESNPLPPHDDENEALDVEDPQDGEETTTTDNRTTTTGNRTQPDPDSWATLVGEFSFPKHTIAHHLLDNYTEPDWEELLQPFDKWRQRTGTGATSGMTHLYFYADTPKPSTFLI